MQDGVVMVEVFDKASCCAGGACGPGPDQDALAFTDAVWNLRRRGITVQIYSLSSDARVFAEHPQIKKLIAENRSPLSLPITIVKDTVVKAGSYPTLVEMEQAITANNGTIQGEASS